MPTIQYHVFLLYVSLPNSLEPGEFESILFNFDVYAEGLQLKMIIYFTKNLNKGV